jgi:hypothetical protein
MTQLLDILGATIIGAFVLVMIANSNLNISQFSDELLVSTVTEYDVLESIEIVDFDLYKIGFGIEGKKIAVADSNQIAYYTDIISSTFPEGNGIKDSIKYYFDESSPLTETDNPDDYSIIRIENNNSTQFSRASKFVLSYYDSMGSKLSYSSLSSETSRNRIKTINVFIEYQSAFALDSNYKTIIWEKTIRPRNLN